MKQTVNSILQKAYVYMSLLTFLCIIGCQNERQKPIDFIFKQLEATYIADLNSCSKALQKIETSEGLDSIKYYYETSRKVFKKMEPIMSFAAPENYKFLNQPNFFKIEEEDATAIKKIAPQGFQVLEEKIFDQNFSQKTIKTNLSFLINRLQFLAHNTSFKKYKTHHLSWIIRDQLCRIASLGITGFDRPVLDNSLKDSQISLGTIQDIIKLATPLFRNKELINQWIAALNAATNNLTSNFETFDRYTYLREHNESLLRLWQQTNVDWEIQFPFEKQLSHSMTSYFSKETFTYSSLNGLYTTVLNDSIVQLGKTLFNEKRFSNQKNMSCATCHQRDKAFTDGLKIRPLLTRNSPTLTYAALQKSFFYEGRAGSLEGQIVSVVKNRNEFHSNLDTIVKIVKQDSVYVSSFKKLYGEAPNNLNIRNAIADYIRSLSKFNSKFDKSISTDSVKLTTKEKDGFNLFMGKAQCATCHFPPLFNGTVPPNFKESELELIGVPQSTDTVNPKVDKDLGRYYVYQTEEKKYFFKTPTVRNSTKTAPYMHNGVYNTLDQVIDFYNKGGGNGLGLKLEKQTLPETPLNLNQYEKKALIAFMKTLEDQ